MTCGIAGTSTAAAQPDEASSNHPQGLKTTAATLAFDHPVSLRDAVQVAQAKGEDVVAYRYENHDIVGEYSPHSDRTVEEFLKEFQADYGTQPEVTGIVVETVVSNEPSTRRATPTIETLRPKFDAPAISLAEHLKPMAEVPTETSKAPTALLAGDWRPNQADVQATNNASPNFLHSYWWFDGSSPSQMPIGWGAEFEVNLYNSASSVNHRPNCPYAYKDKFWAKNYNWNWNVFRPDYQGANLGSIGAYADYNDLSDTCHRNSIAIGMRYPQNIQYVNGAYGIVISVQAPRGTESPNKVGGVVQAVYDGFCNDVIGQFYSFTDCMGVWAGSWPLSSVPAHRLTANVGNDWWVPTKCWFSDKKGTVPAIVTDCGQWD